MTREETKEAIKVMQSYVDGKKIELKYKGQDEEDWCVVNMPSWDFGCCDYRIAPNQEEQKEKHYRPYTMEEFVEDMHKHDGFIKCIRQDENIYGYGIYRINKSDIYLNEDLMARYDQLSKSFIWSDDGTPCGKEVEE